MCTIAGLVLPGRRVHDDVIRARCDQIVHWGPDDEGYGDHRGWLLSLFMAGLWFRQWAGGKRVPAAAGELY